MVITIVVDHPLDVPLSSVHLLFFLAFAFPFEPALHPKARAKVRGLALKGDLIDRLLLVISRFVVLFYRGAQIGKVAKRLVPPLLGTICSCLLPLLALLLSEAREGESALRSMLSFLLRHLLPEPLIVWCLSACWSSSCRIPISSAVLPPVYYAVTGEPPEQKGRLFISLFYSPPYFYPLEIDTLPGCLPTQFGFRMKSL